MMRRRRRRRQPREEDAEANATRLVLPNGESESPLMLSSSRTTKRARLPACVCARAYVCVLKPLANFRPEHFADVYLREAKNAGGLS